MISRIVLLAFSLLLLSACAGDPILQRSANNKLVDAKGFHGGKRRPLYNKKYIERAKQNVVYNDYDEEEDYEADEPDEVVSPAMRNRSMYRGMVTQEQSMKRKKMGQKLGDYRSRLRDDDDYPDIAHARDLSNSSSQSSDANLRKELDEIKSMLSSAKKDLAKYRCPMTGEEAKAKVSSTTKVNKVVKEVAKSEEPIEEPKQEEQAIEPEKAPEASENPATPDNVTPNPVSHNTPASLSAKEDQPNISNMINLAPGSLGTK